MQTKRGKHGLLHRYAIKYNPDPVCHGFSFTWHCWAYSAEHALLKWDEGNNEGWERTSEPQRI
jgi:hypothetical protein